MGDNGEGVLLLLMVLFEAVPFWDKTEETSQPLQKIKVLLSALPWVLHHKQAFLPLVASSARYSGKQAVVGRGGAK